MITGQHSPEEPSVKIVVPFALVGRSEPDQGRKVGPAFRPAVHHPEPLRGRKRQYLVDDIRANLEVIKNNNIRVG